MSRPFFLFAVLAAAAVAFSHASSTSVQTDAGDGIVAATISVTASDDAVRFVGVEWISDAVIGDTNTGDLNAPFGGVQFIARRAGSSQRY